MKNSSTVHRIREVFVGFYQTKVLIISLSRYINFISLICLDPRLD